MAFIAAFATGNLRRVLWTARAARLLSYSAGMRRSSSVCNILLIPSAIRHFYAIASSFLKLARLGGIVIVGTAAAVVVAARPSWRNVGDRFAILALTLFLMEVAGSGVSGRAFEHYFIMWLLPATLLAGLLAQRCGDAIGDRRFAVAAFCGCCAMLVGGSNNDSREGNRT